MDDNTPLWPEAETTVLKLVRTGFGDYFRQYYKGEPNFIPEQLLPAIVVRPMKSNHSLDDAPTGFDVQLDEVMIKIIFNKKDDLNVPPDGLLTETKLKRLISGRDATTGQYLPATVMGILRANITLEGTIINQNNDVQYQFDVQEDGTITSEAHVTVVIRQLVPVTRS